ncbi:hypothetical protein CHS0354_010077 [Potamilus streckersoni]|uniref:Uncharacterized protein n=1 Tax=Potamilus streckersoni TaxID=2493646 RepID=A0AAE0RR80_9BIVA|nr:hypothetical protein CHS0354_010077 [Potamilus streckersoni]
MYNLKVILILTLIGIVLTALCYTLPGWMLFENTDTSEDVQFGLWYYKVCLKDKVCYTISVRDAVETSLISDVNHINEDEQIIFINLMYAAFVVYQIEMTLSIVSGMIGLAVCYKIFKHGHLQQRSYLLYRYLRTLITIGLVANLIAAVLVLLPMGRFANELWHYYQFHTVLELKFGFPYALLLGGTGGVCFSISTLLLILSLIRLQYQGEVSMQLTTQQIPMMIIPTELTEMGYAPVSEPPLYYPPPNYPGDQRNPTQDQAPMLPQKQMI